VLQGNLAADADARAATGTLLVGGHGMAWNCTHAANSCSGSDHRQREPSVSAHAHGHLSIGMKLHYLICLTASGPVRVMLVTATDADAITTMIWRRLPSVLCMLLFGQKQRQHCAGRATDPAQLCTGNSPGRDGAGGWRHSRCGQAPWRCEPCDGRIRHRRIRHHRKVGPAGPKT
jgi:hypothetical protein